MIILFAKWFIEKCDDLEELESFLSMGYFKNQIICIFDLRILRFMKAYNYFKKGE